jgi:hypothetical protein
MGGLLLPYACKFNLAISQSLGKMLKNQPARGPDSLFIVTWYKVVKSSFGAKPVNSLCS